MPGTGLRKMKNGFGKTETFVSQKSVVKKMLAAGAGGVAAGGVLGYVKGKKDGEKNKGHKKKANLYLEKIAASIGEIGKSLIRTKLAPAMGAMSRGAASRVEGMSRAFAGSKVAPRIFSTPEMAQHGTAMANLGKKLMPTTGGMDAGKTNKIMAVAARARRMGVIPGK